MWTKPRLNEITVTGNTLSLRYRKHIRSTEIYGSYKSAVQILHNKHVYNTINQLIKKTITPKRVVHKRKKQSYYLHFHKWQTENEYKSISEKQVL
jgi:hypothetical protein